MTPLILALIAKHNVFSAECTSLPFFRNPGRVPIVFFQTKIAKYTIYAYTVQRF